MTGRLPVSWLPSPARCWPAKVGGRRALVAAARANVQTLVRACWPGTLAPDLSSTRLGFAFVAARHTGVGVVGLVGRRGHGACSPACGCGASPARASLLGTATGSRR